MSLPDDMFMTEMSSQAHTAMRDIWNRITEFNEIAHHRGQEGHFAAMMELPILEEILIKATNLTFYLYRERELERGRGTI